MGKVVAGRGGLTRVVPNVTPATSDVPPSSLIDAGLPGGL
jgi:hypothetical protein